MKFIENELKHYHLRLFSLKNNFIKDILKVIESTKCYLVRTQRYKKIIAGPEAAQKKFKDAKKKLKEYKKRVEKKLAMENISDYHESLNQNQYKRKKKL